MNKKRKNKITNMKRFITMVMAMIILTSLLVTTFVHAETVKSSSYDKVVVCVEDNDTLWGLASKYNNTNMEIRKYIYHVMKDNNLDSPLIYPGQIIYFAQANN